MKHAPAPCPNTVSHVHWDKEHQAGKREASSTAPLEGRGNLDMLHVTGCAGLLPSPFLPCFQSSLQLHIWKPSPCHVCPAAARFPRGGIRQWHFSITLLPRCFPSLPSRAIHVIAATTLCNLGCDFGNTVLEPTHYIC